MNVRYEILLLLFAFFKLCFVPWSGGLEAGNATEEKFITPAFWSYTSCLSDTLEL
jgi:hypothetical protein